MDWASRRAQRRRTGVTGSCRDFCFRPARGCGAGYRLSSAGQRSLRGCAGEDARATPAQELVVRANAVVTFTAPRPAHVFAALTKGPTVIAPIGSPPEAISSQLELHLSTPADFAALLAPRAL